jgi:hypothetical protein
MPARAPHVTEKGYISVTYQKEILRSKLDKNLELKLLIQGIYQSLLPLFKESLSALVSSSFENLVIE